MPRLRLRLSLVSVLLGVGLSACGGGDDATTDTETRSESLAETRTDTVLAGYVAGAEAAYDAAGKSRADDGTKGIPADSCWVLDDEAVAAIEDAVGIEGLVLKPGYVQGPAARETLQCALQVEGEQEPIGLLVGTTDRSRDEVVQGIKDLSDPPQEIDRDVEGLDPDDVVAFSRDAFTNVYFIRDGLKIQIGAPDSLVDPDTLAVSLEVVVEQVSRVLGDA